MQLSYSFKDASQARLAFYSWAHFFAETYGMCLLQFPSMTALALFPHEEIKVEHGLNNPWEVLKEQLGSFEPKQENPLPKWMGFLSYEMGAFAFSDVSIPFHVSRYPLAHFFKHSLYLLLSQNTITLVFKPIELHQLINPPSGVKRYFSLDFWKEEIYSPPPFTLSKAHFFEETFLETKRSYLDKIKCVQSQIEKGDLYQMNLTQSIHYHTSLEPLDIYLRLAQKHPTPFSCYFNFCGYQVISSSPERFLSLKGSKLQTRPIKGTLKKPTHHFEEQIQKLVNSPKEQAELHMICDLMRNDLSRISQLGTVTCLHRQKLLSLSTLYHLEAVIESEALDQHPLDLIRPCFPPGSITGCPKIKAMQWINTLENRARHLYCGSIGYFLENGDFDFNVSIRTAVYQKGVLEYQVGGGLTIDSEPENEYQETLDKALSLKNILKMSYAIKRRNIDFAVY